MSESRSIFHRPYGMIVFRSHSDLYCVECRRMFISSNNLQQASRRNQFRLNESTDLSGTSKFPAPRRIDPSTSKYHVPITRLQSFLRLTCSPHVACGRRSLSFGNHPSASQSDGRSIRSKQCHYQPCEDDYWAWWRSHVYHYLSSYREELEWYVPLISSQCALSSFRMSSDR